MPTPEHVQAALLAGTRDVPDFPKPGVLFKDLTPLFAQPDAFTTVVRHVLEEWSGQVDVVVGVEARGFIIGAPVALELGVGFVPIRKAGKLPGHVMAQEYDLEYGTATVELQHDALHDGQRVLVLDDVLATGGTALAACRLVEQAGAQVTGIQMLMELGFLDGRTRLRDYDVRTLLTI